MSLALSASDVDGERLNHSKPVIVTTGAARGGVGVVVDILPSMYSSGVVCLVRFYDGSEVRLLSRLLRYIPYGN